MALQFFSQSSDIEKEVRARAKAFMDSRVRPTAIIDDINSHFRREFFTELARLKLTALAIPKEFGGEGQSSSVHFAALEEIARGSGAMAVVVAVTNLVQGALVAHGNGAQKKKYLPLLTSGEWLGAFSLSESGSGSDAGSLKLSAKAVQKGYKLNGTKMWCSNGGHADLYLVMTRTSPEKARGITSFLVTKEAVGFRIGKQEKKLGLRASSLTELIFEDCFIPVEQRLGQEGDGFSVALSQLDVGRIGIGACGLGLSIDALERIWPRLINTETNQLFADGYAMLQAIKTLIALASDLKDQGKQITTLAAGIKLLGSDLAMKVTGDVVEFFGEEGYTRGKEVERLMRDAKALQIVEGTNQIQRHVLARQIDRMFS